MTKGSQKTTLCGRGLGDVRIWIALGLTFLLLNCLGNAESKSPYYFAEYFLYGLMFVGLWANEKFDLRKRIPIPRQWAPGLYIFFVWLCGSCYMALGSSAELRGQLKLTGPEGAK